MKQGWELKTLGEVCEIARGGSPRPIKQFLTDSEDGVNWIKIGDTKLGGKYIYQTVEKIKREGIARSRFVQSGSFLLSNSMSFGRPYILKTDGCIHDGWLVLEPNYGLIDQEYLYYVLSSNYVFNQFNEKAAGSTVRNLNTKSVKLVEIPLPPLEEQKRIVAVLDEAFAGLETARTNAEANLKNAEELQKAHLMSVLHSASDSWQKSDLSTLALNLDAKRVPITKKDRVAGEIPYYGASGIVDYVYDFIFDDELLLVSEDGANLLARTYPIAFRVSGKCWVNNHAHVLKFEDQRIARYVELYLNSISVEPWVTGMAQPKLNQRALNSVPIPLPPAQLLESILSSHSVLSENTTSLEQHYTHSSIEITNIRQSLLQKAFAGELT